jgi:hypothetical protein
MNRTERGVLHKAVCKLTKGVLLGKLSILTTGRVKCQYVQIIEFQRNVDKGV